jgi:hypothetical protein
MISGPRHNGHSRCMDRRTAMRPNRDACDRCHSIKTRCVRTEYSEICVRCERLGSSCHYSPAGRTGRPLGSQKRNIQRRPAKSKKGLVSEGKSSPGGDQLDSESQI